MHAIHLVVCAALAGGILVNPKLQRPAITADCVWRWLARAWAPRPDAPATAAAS